MASWLDDTLEPPFRGVTVLPAGVGSPVARARGAELAQLSVDGLVSGVDGRVVEVVQRTLAHLFAAFEVVSPTLVVVLGLASQHLLFTIHSDPFRS